MIVFRLYVGRVQNGVSENSDDAPSLRGQEKDFRTGFPNNRIFILNYILHDIISRKGLKQGFSLVINFFSIMVISRKAFLVRSIGCQCLLRYVDWAGSAVKAKLINAIMYVISDHDAKCTDATRWLVQTELAHALNPYLLCRRPVHLWSPIRSPCLLTQSCYPASWCMAHCTRQTSPLLSCSVWTLDLIQTPESEWGGWPCFSIQVLLRHLLRARP